MYKRNKILARYLVVDRKSTQTTKFFGYTVDNLDYWYILDNLNIIVQATHIHVHVNVDVCNAHSCTYLELKQALPDWIGVGNSAVV